MGSSRMGLRAPPGSAQESLSESAFCRVERFSPLALVSRSSQELAPTPPLEWSSPKGTTYRGFMSATSELIISDLQLRPSSAGSGGFVAFLAFQDVGYSGQENNSQSRQALILSVKVDPKELPLLSGLIGRSFSVRWREPQKVAEYEDLFRELAQLREKYQHLRWVLGELATQEHP